MTRNHWNHEGATEIVRDHWNCYRTTKLMRLFFVVLRRDLCYHEWGIQRIHDFKMVTDNSQNQIGEWEFPESKIELPKSTWMGIPKIKLANGNFKNLKIGWVIHWRPLIGKSPSWNWASLNMFSHVDENVNGNFQNLFLDSGISQSLFKTRPLIGQWLKPWMGIPRIYFTV